MQGTSQLLLTLQRLSTPHPPGRCTASGPVIKAPTHKHSTVLVWSTMHMNCCSLAGHVAADYTYEECMLATTT
jgi:hypothetical protein